MFFELNKDLSDISEFFSLLSDPTRLKIIICLKESEQSVSELSKNLGISQSAVSHQLRILRQGRVVRYRKVGKKVLYSLDDEHVVRIIDQAIEHQKHG
ncbi:MAG: metalloregulator ArsR/SmtB family transcription factor [Fervidobacterium sp.]|nr:metalloregulator ArsR/SmtB family transcription factor [Fervidobacterium sp.]